MGKFNLHDFVLKTLKKMKEANEDEYKVLQYSLKYYEKGVLEDTDLEEVQKWFEDDEKKEEVSEPTTYPKEEDEEWVEGKV